MSHKTPWSQSSLLSDRVRPKSPATNTPKAKGKAKEPPAEETPKSPAVLALEKTISRLQNEPGNKKDAKGGCFCLARTHELSPYCPICMHCGLILCLLNAPCYACPHCSALLLSPTAKVSLLERLRNDLAGVVAKEEEEAERAREEAWRAAGAFPTLQNSTNASQPQQVQQIQTRTHKVLSLNSKTKRVTVASYTPTPKPTQGSIRSEMKEREPSPERVPPPLGEIVVAPRPPCSGRPWQDVRGDGFVGPLTYVRDPRADREQLAQERKARKKNKRNAIGNDDGGNGEGRPSEVEGGSNAS